MATTASVHTNTYGGRTITLKVEEISTSIENNTSTVKWTLTSGTSSTYHSVYDITAWVGGTEASNKVYGSKTADWSTRAFPCKDGSTSGTIIVPHNADGTYTGSYPFRLRGSVYNNNPQNYDSSINLTTIPRASSFTLSGGTIGSTISVSITRASNTFTHKVYCTYGGKTQTISNDAGTSASATLDMDFCNYIATSTSASATMYVETYSGGTYVGTTSTQFTMSVPGSVVPSISSVTKTDTSNLLATYGSYVQSKSNLRVQTSASGSYSSSITSIVVNTKDSNGNIIRTLNGNDVIFQSVNYVGTATIQVIVTDSRNRQATNTSTISIASYSNPYISYFTAERLNNDATVTLTWDASITNINNANANGKSFNVYKRQKGSSSWSSAIATYTSGYTYSNNNFTTSCDENYGWEFKFEAIDSFATSSITKEVGTAFELINWKDDGTAMAIGKVSEKSNTLEIELDTEINGTLTFPTIRQDNGVAGFTYDQYGNMKHKRSDSGDNFGIDRYDGTRMLYYYPESGTLAISRLEGSSSNNNILYMGHDSTTEVNFWNGMAFYKNNNLFYSNGPIQTANIAIAESGFRSSNNTGSVGSQTITDGITIKRAGSDYSPGNGQVLEASMFSGWGGQLYIGDNATQGIWYNGWSSGTKGRWKRLCPDDSGYGVELYNDATGTQGSITLSETSANFDYLEIYYRDGNYYQGCTKIYSPDGKQVSLTSTTNYLSGSNLYLNLKAKTINISGNTINVGLHNWVQILNKNINAHNQNDDLYITRVVGIRNPWYS